MILIECRCGNQISPLFMRDNRMIPSLVCEDCRREKYLVKGYWRGEEKGDREIRG